MAAHENLRKVTEFVLMKTSLKKKQVVTTNCEFLPKELSHFIPHVCRTLEQNFFLFVKDGNKNSTDQLANGQIFAQ